MHTFYMFCEICCVFACLGMCEHFKLLPPFSWEFMNRSKYLYNEFHIIVYYMPLNVHCTAYVV